MKFKPWHTPLLAIFPILTLFASNNQFVQLKDLWVPLAISFVAFILLASVFSLVFKSWIKGGLLASLLAIMFYSYGLYQDLSHGYTIPFDHNFYKWSCLILLIIVIWQLFKTNKSLKILNSLVNLFAVFLVLMPTYRIVVFEYSRASIKLEGNLAEIDSASVALNPDRPTIYYLIMDAYTRQDILQEYFDYDNSDFINFLKSEGFYVAEKSISNYGQTILSIPSSMNMMYMDSVISKIGSKSRDRLPMTKVLNNSKLLRFLDQQDYKSVSYDASMWDMSYLKSADIFHYTPGTNLSLFHSELINTTAIRSFNRGQKIKSLSQEDHHRKKILNAFDRIGKIPSKLVPYYVHGHILAPHQPFLFDKDGKPQPMEEGYNIWSPLAPKSDSTAYKKGYVGQLQYINKRLKQLITKIIYESKRPAIIILQGDHGTASELRNHKGFENNDFKERFSILNAYYFPDKDYSMIYPEISPVNSFKVVMNKYFDKNIKLEEDKAFYGNWNQPFNLVDVTEQVRK